MTSSLLLAILLGGSETGRAGQGRVMAAPALDHDSAESCNPNMRNWQVDHTVKTKQQAFLVLYLIAVNLMLL